MTSSLSANASTCSLEMLVGVVERVIAQERQLQDAVKQIASINSTLVTFKTDMKSKNAVDVSELTGSLVGMIHDLRRELYVEIDELKQGLSIRKAASVPATDKEEFPKPGRMETLGTHEGKDAISEERVEPSEHLIDVTAEQTEANGSGVYEQFQEQQDLHSELHRLSDQVCVLRQQLAKIDISEEQCHRSGIKTRSLVIKDDETMNQETSSSIVSMEMRQSESRRDSRTWKGIQSGSFECIGLEHSLWDTAFVMFCHFPDGRQMMSTFNRLFIAINILLNIFFQLLFISSIASMSSSPFDKKIVEAMRRQRLRTGHENMQLDHHTGRTLTAMLCNGEVHSLMGLTWQEVIKYLDTSIDLVGIHLESMPHRGIITCMLAMFIWTSSMMEEMRRSWDMTLSLASLGKKDLVKKLDDGLFMIDGMNKQNKLAVMLLVCVPRLLIAILLLVYGLQFLAYTHSVSDIILNACALEIVKTVDEYMFLVLASRHLMQTVQNAHLRIVVLDDDDVWYWIRPEVIGDSNRRKATFALSRFLCIVASLLLGYYMFLHDFLDQLHQVKNALCEQDTSFTYMMHPTSLLPFFPKTVLDEDHQCFFAAFDELLRLRAGFKPKYVPNLFLAVVREHKTIEDEYQQLSYLTHDEYFSTSFCNDFDVEFKIIRHTCLEYPHKHVNTNFLSAFENCSVLAPFCFCAANLTEKGSSHHCTHEGLEKMVELSGIPEHWLVTIRNICPRTCGRCSKEFVDHHGESHSHGEHGHEEHGHQEHDHEEDGHNEDDHSEVEHEIDAAGHSHDENDHQGDDHQEGDHEEDGHAKDNHIAVGLKVDAADHSHDDDVHEDHDHQNAQHEHDGHDVDNHTEDEHKVDAAGHAHDADDHNEDDHQDDDHEEDELNEENHTEDEHTVHVAGHAHDENDHKEYVHQDDNHSGDGYNETSHHEDEDNDDAAGHAHDGDD